MNGLIEIFVASSSLVFFSPERILNIARKAGLHGVEWLLLKPLSDQHYLMGLRQLNNQFLIQMTLHRLWDAPSLSTHILKLLDKIPQDTDIRKIFPGHKNLPVPVVNFPDKEEECLPGTVIQSGGNMGKGARTLEELVVKIRAKGLSMAFDPMHALEVHYGGYHKIPFRDGIGINRFLIDFFLKHQDIISEIHLYNFRGSKLPLPIVDLVHKNLKPGHVTGCLLDEGFLNEVVKAGWKGKVVLEIHHLRLITGSLRGPVQKLRSYRRRIETIVLLSRGKI